MTVVHHHHNTPRPSPQHHHSYDQLHTTSGEAGTRRQKDESYCLNAFQPPPNCGVKLTSKCVSHKTPDGEQEVGESRRPNSAKLALFRTGHRNRSLRPWRTSLNRRFSCICKQWDYHTITTIHHDHDHITNMHKKSSLKAR